MSRINLISVVTVLISLFSCGTGNESVKKSADQLVDSRNDSEEANACRAEKTFFDATRNKCMNEYKLADFSCTTEELGKRIVPQVKSAMEKQANDGYTPLSCGVKGSGSVVEYIVSWKKLSESGVMLMTQSYLGKEVAQTGKDDGEDSFEDKLGLVGSWKECSVNYNQVKVVTLTFEKGKFTQNNIQYSGDSCENLGEIEQVIKEEGTWSLLNEGKGTIDDASAMKVSVTKKTIALHTQSKVDTSNTFKKCKLETWDIGKEVDVTSAEGVGCGNYDSVFYVFVAIENKKLRTEGADLTSNRSTSTLLRSYAYFDDAASFAKQ